MSTNIEHESGKAKSYIPLTAVEKDPGVSDRYKNKVRKHLENSVDNIHRNPCFEECQMTIRCLQKTGDTSQCQMYSQNAMICKKFWHRVMKERKRMGISPILPAVEDRPQVLKDHAHWLK